MTHRIEVGQRWRYTGDPGKFFTAGKEYTVTRGVSEDGWFRIEDDSTGNHGWQDDDDFHHQFEFVDPDEPALPVRTVTRLEIVPGTYGRISVAMKPMTLGEPRPTVQGGCCRRPT